MHIWGSSELLQTLIAAELVDEFRTWVFPLVLGKGKRLFENGAPPRGLTLVESRSAPKGILFNTYHPAGPLRGDHLLLKIRPKPSWHAVGSWPPRKLKADTEGMTAMSSSVLHMSMSLNGFIAGPKLHRAIQRFLDQHRPAISTLSRVRVHDLKHTFGRRLRAAGAAVLAGMAYGDLNPI